VNISGIVPCRDFASIDSSVSFDKLEKDCGIVPVIVLISSLICNFTKFDRQEIVEGMVPFPFEIDSADKFDNSPISSGTGDE
jgi:hypothetical protein